MKIAALFPGQGSHSVGMGADLTAAFPEAAEVYTQVEHVLPGLRALIEQGPLEDLTLTANQQPALVAASVAAYRAWRAQTGLTPAFAAGHSLGEYSALVAADALSLGDALRLTRQRGELMQAAVPVGAGAMSAVMGDPAIVAEVCAGTEGAQPANFNAPPRPSSAARRRRGRRERRPESPWPESHSLKVSAPFHCPLMAPAAAGLAPELQTTAFAPTAFPSTRTSPRSRTPTPPPCRAC